MSGLPGAGKSTVARALAHRLHLPLIDKDVILEALFDSLGVGDSEWRERLSRAADEVLFATAPHVPHGILDSWWHHDVHPARFRAMETPMVEVHCQCPPEVALERFRRRERHPGHLDRDWTEERADAWVARARTEYPGPLRLGGPLIVVDTETAVDIEALCDRIRAAAPDC